MRRRQIVETEIEEALANPFRTYPSDDASREDRTVICGITGKGRRLKVVVPAADTGYVVTVADMDDER
jgi:hypothetical protein